MTSVHDALRAARSAVDSLSVAAAARGDAWARPRAPGKWSPAQIVEHVARALEESGNVVAGRPSRMPALPAPLRPLVRRLFFNRVLRNQTFPKARSARALNPTEGPPTPAAGRTRLEEAFRAFETECRIAAPQQSMVTSTAFGSVRLVEYIRFQELHTLHHVRQLKNEPAQTVN
jgi:hypothetical protein